jgi:hypothetical protein
MIQRNASMCEGPGCDTWSREPEDHGFLMLTWDNEKLPFCSGDCAMRWLSENTKPVEVL